MEVAGLLNATIGTKACGMEVEWRSMRMGHGVVARELHARPHQGMQGSSESLSQRGAGKSFSHTIRLIALSYNTLAYQ